MARRLGEAFVVITPDPSGFREKAVAGIKKALTGVSPTVLVRADVTQAMLTTAALRKQIRELVGRTATIKLGVDDAAGRVQILRFQAQLHKLNEYVSRPKVTVEGRKQALADIYAISAALDKLNARTAAAQAANDRGLLGNLAGRVLGLNGGGRGRGRGGRGVGGIGGILAAGPGPGTIGGAAAANPAAAAGIIGVIAASTLTGWAGIIPLIVSATAAIGAFGALALPTLSDLQKALATVSTATDTYVTASTNLNTAIHQSPADMAAYRAVLKGLEPDLANAAVLLTNTGITWQTLTPVQRASAIALRNNAAAYKTLLPSQKDALNALIKEGNAWNSLTPAQQTAGTAIQKLQGGFQSMADALAPITFQVFNAGLKVANDLLPFLAPLATAAGNALTGLLTQLDAFILGPKTKSPADFLPTPTGGPGKNDPAAFLKPPKAETGFKGFIDNMTKLAGPAITAIGQGFGKVGVALGKLLVAMESPDALRILGGLFTALAGTLNVLAWAFTHVTPIMIGWMHKFASNFDIIRHNAAANVHQISDYIDTLRVVWVKTGHAVEKVWNNIAAKFDAFRHRTAVVFDGIRGDIHHIWNMVWTETIGRAIQGGQDLQRIFNNVTNWLRVNVLDQWGHFFTVMLPNAFRTAVTAIGSIWNGIKNAIAGPVNWVLHNTIGRLDAGINAVAGWVGLHPNLPTFAGGGKVTRGTGPTSDDVLARVSRGETVVSAAHSKQLAPFFSAIGVPGYAGGGIPHRGTGLGTGPPSTSGSSPLSQLIGGAGSFLAGLFGKAGDVAKILVALASGNATAADNAFMALIGGPSAGGATGGLAATLLAIPGELIKDAVGFLLAPVKAFAGKAQSAQNARAAGTAGGGVQRWRGLVLQALAMEGLSASLVNDVLYQMQTECVTIDTVILTKRGWLDYTEVQAGDETIGYNPDTGHNEWTRIERVVHYPQRETWRFGNKYWSVKCTPNHRWLTEHVVRRPSGGVTMSRVCPECSAPFGGWRAVQIHRARVHGVAGTRHGEATAEVITGTGLLPLQDIGLQDRIVLAREADTGTSLDITISEAALLGWIAGDGWVSEPRDYYYERKPEPDREPPDARAPFGYRRDGQPKKNRSGRPPATGPVHKTSPLTIGICQAKPEHFAAIDAACSADRHLRAKTAPARNPSWREVKTWRLSTAYSRDLLARVGNPKTDAVGQVLRMSAGQREAWLGAMIAAEGHRGETKTVIYQNDGPVADAIELAVYLCGYRPARGKDPRAGHDVWRIGLTAPHAGGPSRNSFREPAGYQDVWCVTTTLGTWTARQEGHVFLTGNSGGNPNAVNQTDINFQMGDPSRGLMQVIGATFARWHWPGTSWDIFDPLANIAAALNYAAHGKGFGSGPGQIGSGHGYAAGGIPLPGAASGATAVSLRARLAAAQKGERASFFGLEHSFAIGPRKYLTKLTRNELATLAKRQATEQLAYAHLAGAGMTAASLEHFGATARAESRTASDLALNRIPGGHPLYAKGLRGYLATLSSLSGTKIPAGGGTGRGGGGVIPGPPLPAITHTYGALTDLIEAFLQEHVAPFARGGLVMDRGGWLRPGWNATYNATGRPEHLVPAGENLTITFEFKGSGNNAFDQLMMAWLKKTVKVKGGGNVQRTFGAH